MSNNTTLDPSAPAAAAASGKLRPDNEALRQYELDEYLLIDSLPETEFDDIVHLAALVCQAPVAMVSLSDHDRQWFKSKIGLTMQQMLRDDSFCSHAAFIGDGSLLVIPDTAVDPRTADSSLVAGTDADRGGLPAMRFFAAAPLVNVTGYTLGALSVLDTQPRTLNDEQAKSLLALGRLTMSLIEQRRDRLELIHSVEATLDREDAEEKAATPRASAPTPGQIGVTALAGGIIGYALGALGRRP